jgi:LuxR family maltose regulon positive regulatory protein
MNVPLLSTKLNRPPTRGKIVSRPRLQEQLASNLMKDGSFFRRLTLVSAPAGYGKTTLVLDWTNRVEMPVGWVSLDEGDNDPRRFITYLIAALRQVDANIGQSAEKMLQSPEAPPDDLLLTALVNEIAATEQPFMLVLDDYHVISTMAIHQQIGFLLDHQPNNLHLVITTRENPLLPVSRLRARGQMLEIGQADLRFSGDEVSTFLDDVMGLKLEPEEVGALEQRTEGWIAGLQLAALSMQGRDDLSGFIQTFTGSNRFILDYLIEEVFEQQREDVKEFLLKTAVLDRLSGPLCNAVTGRQDSQDLLEMLEQANLFIVPLDQSREWYRYHRLFSELLRHRLRVSDLDEAEIHRLAGGWFEINGLMNEAIQHALQARDWEKVSGLITQASGEYLKRGEVMTVIGWFQTIPEEVLAADPRLCFEYCWPLMLATQYEKAAPLLEQVEQAAQDIPPFLGEVYAAQAYQARGTGDHARMVEYSQKALGLLPRTATNSRGIVAVNLGLAYWHMGRMEAAKEALSEALEIGQATGNHYAALTALIFLGRTLAVQGKLHQADELFRSAIEQGGNIPINALAYMDLASLHYEWNALELCEQHLLKAIELCERARNFEFLVGARMIESQLQLARGNLPAAEDALDQAWMLVREGKVPGPTVQRLEASQAKLMMAKGEDLGEWAEKLSEKVDCHSYYRFLGVTKAETMDRPEALDYLEGLGQAANANGWTYGLIAVLTRQARLADSRGEGLAFLTEGLRLAEGGGFIRLFMDAGEELVPLLSAAAQQGEFSGYAERVLQVFGSREVDQSGLAETLSERELEVLQLVSSGLSNREIAEKLVISIGTAKTHVHNICGKLGVRNRTEAAMKAQQLKLILDE